MYSVSVFGISTSEKFIVSASGCSSNYISTSFLLSQLTAMPYSINNSSPHLFTGHIDCVVGLNRISLMSTLSGWLMAKTAARAKLSEGIEPLA